MLPATRNKAIKEKEEKNISGKRTRGPKNGALSRLVISELWKRESVVSLGMFLCTRNVWADMKHGTFFAYNMHASDRVLHHIVSQANVCGSVQVPFLRSWRYVLQA